MISIKSSINNRPNFTGKVSVPKMILPALGLACCFGTTPIKADTFSKTDSTIVATDSLQSKKYVTQLDSTELAKAPSPIEVSFFNSFKKSVFVMSQHSAKACFSMD